MILDRPIDLPRSIAGAPFPAVGEDGERFNFYGAFNNLKFTVDGDEVNVTGTIVLAKTREVKPLWRRFLGVAFKRFREPATIQVWWLEVRFKTLIGRYKANMPEELINAGLEKNIVLHRSLVSKVLQDPTTSLREAHSRLTPLILGQPRNAANAA